MLKKLHYYFKYPDSFYLALYNNDLDVFKRLFSTYKTGTCFMKENYQCESGIDLKDVYLIPVEESLEPCEHFEHYASHMALEHYLRSIKRI